MRVGDEGMEKRREEVGESLVRVVKREEFWIVIWKR